MDNSYLAGFIDGEGHISVRLRLPGNRHNRKPTYDIQVQIGQKTLEPLNSIQEVYGGHLRLRSPGKHGECWLLTWACRADVMEILTAIEPYIIGKRVQVLEAIAVLNTLRPFRGHHKTK